MSIPTVHFQSIRPDGTRPLCERAGVRCAEANSSLLRHDVTCKLCLKRLMTIARRSEAA
jgi:hypothetical protein